MILLRDAFGIDARPGSPCDLDCHPLLRAATLFRSSQTMMAASGIGRRMRCELIVRNWGMPMSQRADPELATTGPYARIRHPIYSGVILGTVGTATAVSLYWLNAVAILGAYFLFSAVIEERTMARLFPTAYPPYKRATKMLIPYLL